MTIGMCEKSSSAADFPPPQPSSPTLPLFFALFLGWGVHQFFFSCLFAARPGGPLAHRRATGSPSFSRNSAPLLLDPFEALCGQRMAFLRFRVTFFKSDITDEPHLSRVQTPSSSRLLRKTRSQRLRPSHQSRFPPSLRQHNLSYQAFLTPSSAQGPQVGLESEPETQLPPAD